MELINIGFDLKQNFIISVCAMFYEIKELSPTSPSPSLAFPTPPSTLLP